MVKKDNEDRRPNNDAQITWGMDNKAGMSQSFGASPFTGRK